MRTKNSQVGDKILCVAARLFATHRFHEARMEDIAAAAEVGKGTLYRYFKDKEELFTALLDQAAAELSQLIQQEIAEAEGTAEKLEAIVHSSIHYFDENPHLFDLIQHAEAMYRVNKGFSWKKTREEIIALVRDIFATAKANGEFAIEDPGFAALMLLGGVRAVNRFGERPRPPDLARNVVEHFLHGCARPTSKPKRGNGVLQKQVV